MKKHNLRTAIAIAASATAMGATAVEPMPIKVGGMTITPTMRLTETYDDNIREVGVNDESSWVTSISPNVLVEALDGLNVYQLEYGIRHDIFHSSHDDNNTDHNVRGMAHFDINSRNRLTFNASYDRTESLSDTTVIGQNDKFNNLYMDAIYGFGVPSATFNVDLGVNHLRRRTHNSGTLNLDREYDKLGYIGTFYVNVSPRTRALLEYRHDDYDYQLSTSRLDNTRERYYAGATWAATAKTTGNVRIGYERRDFDDRTMDDASGTSWEADVTWAPRTYSTVTLSTSKGFEEGRVFSNYVDTTQAGVNWNHHWSQQLSSDLFYRWINEDFEEALVPRDDDINEVGFDVRYDIQRWLTVGVGYRFKDRDSNVAVRDYDRNMYMLNVDVSL